MLELPPGFDLGLSGLGILAFLAVRQFLEGRRLLKPLEAFFVHGKIQLQRPLDGDTSIPEVCIVKYPNVLPFGQGAVQPRNGVALFVRDLVALVAQGLTHFLEKTRGVHELNPALTTGGFTVGHNPQVGVDAGVVEELVRQGHNGFEPVVLNDPAPDFALARTGTAGKERRAVEDNGQARTTLFGWLHLADHVLQEQQRPVVNARQSCAETPAESLFLVLAPDVVGLGLPLHAKGWIGEHVVELLSGKVVLGKAIAKGNMFDVLTLDHHVRPAHGKGLTVVVLTEGFKPGVRVEFSQVILGDGEHTAGAAGWVEATFSRCPWLSAHRRRA